MQLLYNYDVICLTEVKTSLSVSLPGYVMYRSNLIGSGNRGGTVVFVRNRLSHLVLNVDVSIGDQVWIQFGSAEGILFGFCYIPPSDSPYYSQSSFASIQEKIYTNHVSGYVLMGDMNCRFGKTVRYLLNDCEDNMLSYPVISDDIGHANDNAEILTAICKDNGLLVLNNLRTLNKHFTSNKTYRKGGVWISEIETCSVTEYT